MEDGNGNEINGSDESLDGNKVVAAFRDVERNAHGRVAANIRSTDQPEHVSDQNSFTYRNRIE